MVLLTVAPELNTVVIHKTTFCFKTKTVGGESLTIQVQMSYALRILHVNGKNVIITGVATIFFVSFVICVLLVLSHLQDYSLDFSLICQIIASFEDYFHHDTVM